jgi:hypothetical protein
MWIVCREAPHIFVWHADAPQGQVRADGRVPKRQIMRVTEKKYVDVGGMVAVAVRVECGVDVGRVTGMCYRWQNAAGNDDTRRESDARDEQVADAGIVVERSDVRCKLRQHIDTSHAKHSAECHTFSPRCVRAQILETEVSELRGNIPRLTNAHALCACLLLSLAIVAHRTFCAHIRSRSRPRSRGRSSGRSGGGHLSMRDEKGSTASEHFTECSE